MEERAELRQKNNAERERAYDAECFLVFDVCRMHGMASLFIGSVHCRGSTAIMAVIKARP